MTYNSKNENTNVYQSVPGVFFQAWLRSPAFRLKSALIRLRDLVESERALQTVIVRLSPGMGRWYISSKLFLDSGLLHVIWHTKQKHCSCSKIISNFIL